MGVADVADGLERPQSTAEIDRWWFGFCAPDQDVFGWLELRWYPRRRIAHYTASVVGRHRGLIVAVDDAIPMKSPSRSLEFRHTGMWAHHVCEEPWERWTVGLEAYGVALDSRLGLQRKDCIRSG